MDENRPQKIEEKLAIVIDKYKDFFDKYPPCTRVFRIMTSGLPENSTTDEWINHVISRIEMLDWQTELIRAMREDVKQALTLIRAD